MDDAIIISNLNDFIFCPVSIYFHNLYGNRATITYQCSDQINGTKAHESVDNKTYSTKKSVLMSLDIYCEKYNLVGKIDMYDTSTGVLTERKRKINKIYDGYVYQLFAQYFALKEMGYDVKKIQFYSISDNKKYPIPLPEDDKEMFIKFETVINSIKNFEMDGYIQSNVEKCKHCIYEPACDRGLV
ncbi:MAG: type V CRISPR-associated protein Cas4 [Lachnospiraceae bacterium]|jgi:CRISPR-associated protein Cas4|nr:type V CRISPR-associated protein Cas4 [Lachnospiraceae bacterium]